jgi:hypothetical protein
VLRDLQHCGYRTKLCFQQTRFYFNVESQNYVSHVLLGPRFLLLRQSGRPSKLQSLSHSCPQRHTSAAALDMLSRQVHRRRRIALHGLTPARSSSSSNVRRGHCCVRAGHGSWPTAATQPHPAATSRCTISMRHVPHTGAAAVQRLPPKVHWLRQLHCQCISAGALNHQASVHPTWQTRCQQVDKHTGTSTLQVYASCTYMRRWQMVPPSLLTHTSTSTPSATIHTHTRTRMSNKFTAHSVHPVPP